MTFGTAPESQAARATGTGRKTTDIARRSESVGSPSAETAIASAANGREIARSNEAQASGSGTVKQALATTGGNCGKERAMGFEPTTSALGSSLGRSENGAQTTDRRTHYTRSSRFATTNFVQRKHVTYGCFLPGE